MFNSLFPFNFRFRTRTRIFEENEHFFPAQRPLLISLLIPYGLERDSVLSQQALGRRAPEI